VGRFRVRRATLRDLDALILQRHGMWEDMGVRDRVMLDDSDRAYRKWARPEIERGRLIGWIVEAPGRVIAGGGCLWLRPAIPKPGVSKHIEPYLVSMFTEPGFRRKGVASRVISEAMAWCKRNGYSRMLLHASEKGRRLYLRSGFSRTWEMRLKLGNTRRAGGG